jgi:2,3-bisphosphoglycerate-dependent phosphoglycerate mutase
MPTVWFIRHGQSQSDAGLRTIRPVLTELTKRGVEEAECVAKAFSRKPSLIITSKYPRTQQTAQPTIKRFPFPDTKQEQWDVYEFTYLSWSHSSFMSMEERRPMVDDFWERNDPSYSDGEGAESFIQFMSRVVGVLERLRYTKEDFIAVFTHGYFMQAVLWLLRTIPSRIDSDSMREFRDQLETSCVPNGAILPVKLRRGDKTWVGDIIVSHFPQMEGSQPVGERHLSS